MLGRISVIEKNNELYMDRYAQTDPIVIDCRSVHAEAQHNP